MTFLLITGSDEQVADRRMTTTVKLILAQPLIAGSPPAVGHVMGNRMLHRGAFAQGSSTTLRLDLGAELVLELFVLANGQTPAVPEPGFGTLRAHRTRITGTGRKLGVLAWDHRYRLTVGTRDRAVREVQREVVLGKQRPALRPGAGNDVHALRGPLGNPRARHIPQVDVQLEQACALLQLLRQEFHGLMFRVVGRTDHHLARDVAVQVQSNVLFEAVERLGSCSCGRDACRRPQWRCVGRGPRAA